MDLFIEQVKYKYVVYGKFKSCANPHFVAAAPERIENFFHDLDKEENNVDFFNWLSTEKHDLICENKDGKLKLYNNEALVYEEEGTTLPVKFFYIFNHIKFKEHPAIQDKFIWRHEDSKVKIENENITSYALFDVLLPKFGIVVSAGEHTIGEEKLTRTNIKKALEKKIYVYLTDEHGQIYPVDTLEQIELNRDTIWGKDKDNHIYKKRLIVFSKKELE